MSIAFFDKCVQATPPTYCEYLCARIWCAELFNSTFESKWRCYIFANRLNRLWFVSKIDSLSLSSALLRLSFFELHTSAYKIKHILSIHICDNSGDGLLWSGTKTIMASNAREKKINKSKNSNKLKMDNSFGSSRLISSHPVSSSWNTIKSNDAFENKIKQKLQ